MQLGHTLHWALPHFQAYTVLLVRIAGLMSVFPILNSRSIPMTIKTALVTVLGLALFAAYNVPDQIARRWFARTPPAARLVKFTLGAQGLIVAS